jgi:ribonuclease HII
MPTIRRKPDFKKDFYENQAWLQDSTVLGIDEVGRGCLAGPVVAGAVILHPNKTNRLIKDSKLLDHEELIKAFTWITKNSWWGVGIIHHRWIDQINIYQASMLAMSRATSQVLSIAPVNPHCALVDAVPLELSSFQGDVISFIYGEKKSSSIAAASIVAKVTRDRLLGLLEVTIPGYDFKGHKGYSTVRHKKALADLGACMIHRESFIDHFDFSEADQQQNCLNFSETPSVVEHA